MLILYFALRLSLLRLPSRQCKPDMVEMDGAIVFQRIAVDLVSSFAIGRLFSLPFVVRCHPLFRLPMAASDKSHPEFDGSEGA